MIRHFHVENFKCLLNVDLDFGPLTVLIGPNDSGKSSILDALYRLGQTVVRPLSKHQNAVFQYHNKLQSGDLPLNLVWRRDPSRDLIWKITATVVDEIFEYRLHVPTVDRNQYRESLESSTLQLRFNPGDNSFGVPDSTQLSDKYSAARMRHDSQADQIGAAMMASAPYRLDPAALASMSEPQPGPVLSPTGDNLAAVLDALITGPDQSARADLEQALRDQVPSLRGIALTTARIPDAEHGRSMKAIEFALTGPRPFVTIPAALVSDGALLLTAFLTLAYTDTPEVLLIEEPENGLHPSRMGAVIDLLRKMSTGEIGNRKRQIILTTHSPILLNFVKPEEVRIVKRNETGATEVTPFTSVPDAERLLKEFGIGELWYLLGEEGLLQGKRP